MWEGKTNRPLNTVRKLSLKRIVEDSLYSVRSGNKVILLDGALIWIVLLLERCYMSQEQTETMVLMMHGKFNVLARRLTLAESKFFLRSLH